MKLCNASIFFALHVQIQFDPDVVEQDEKLMSHNAKALQILRAHKKTSHLYIPSNSNHVFCTEYGWNDFSHQLQSCCKIEQAVQTQCIDVYTELHQLLGVEEEIAGKLLVSTGINGMFQCLTNN